MDINDLTLGKIKELQSLISPGGGDTNDQGMWKVGQNYLIRTVTMILIGKLKAVGHSELLLSDAAWIADTGRFANALKDASLAEIEPFLDDVIVGRGALVDATNWRHDLPREQK